MLLWAQSLWKAGLSASWEVGIPRGVGEEEGEEGVGLHREVGEGVGLLQVVGLLRVVGEGEGEGVELLLPVEVVGAGVVLLQWVEEVGVVQEEMPRWEVGEGVGLQRQAWVASAHRPTPVRAVPSSSSRPVALPPS